MILSEQQTKQLTKNEPYDCALVKQQWAYQILREQTSPLGSIIAFQTPLQMGALNLDKVLVVAGELPNTNSFGGVAFLRLFSAQVGSLLSELIQKSCHVDESSIFVEQQQCSISVTNKFKDSFLFHLIFSTGKSESLHNINLPEEDMQKFQTAIVDSFHFLTKSIFLETQRDNF